MRGDLLAQRVDAGRLVLAQVVRISPEVRVRGDVEGTRQRAGDRHEQLDGGLVALEQRRPELTFRGAEGHRRGGDGRTASLPTHHDTIICQLRVGLDDRAPGNRQRIGESTFGRQGVTVTEDSPVDQVIERSGQEPVQRPGVVTPAAQHRCQPGGFDPPGGIQSSRIQYCRIGSRNGLHETQQ